jgi:Skp family chaperone for outer membrane proteins
MKRLVLAASLGLLLPAASASGQAAQAPAQQQPATQAPAPKPAGQPPAQPQAPAAPQTPPAQAPPTLPPPAPFPQGAKAAYVNLQAIAQLSADGKAAASKANALAQKKQTEIAEKTKALQGAEQKLQTSGGVLSDSARAQLERDIQNQRRDLERLQQDAQAELTNLQQDLQAEFQKKLIPILERLAKEKGLQMLFSGGDAGLIWTDPGLDLTLEAVKLLDAATSGAAKPKQ